jgi:Tol biopolymer transport system component
MIGSRLGPYDVTAKLGRGGMGEVYRAHDRRLDREVALKVLPEGLTADPERLARFEREAKVLAQLHHPHIASIFGLEESGAIRALVMELVEGPTLAERLAGGALPVDETLSIARQIAAALEAAHEKGIVHRDLKPQNIKVRPDGAVKVLDFGLAKAASTQLGSSPSASRLAESPTITQGATELGVVLGTAAYMAPEQAKGLAVDMRADFWAFGVVLYEMLVGRSLFAGETVTDTLAGVLKNEIDFERLPQGTPPALRSLLRRCLVRNPKNRLHDIADARIVLDEIAAGRGDPEAAALAPALARPSPPPYLPYLVGALGLAAGLLAAWRPWAGTGAAPAPALTRLEVSLPPGVEPLSGIAGLFALSPDGRTVAMIGVRDGQRQLYLRPFGRADSIEIPGTAGVNSAAFSPDSSAVVFVPGSAQVTRLSIADQSRTVLVSGADLETTVGWGPSGVYFNREGAIWLVPGAGGEPRQLAPLEAARGEVSQIDPLEVPESGQVVFTSLSRGDEPARLEAVALASGARRVLVERATSPGWSPTGHLLFERDGILWAAPFDARNTALSGPPVAVVRGAEIGSLRYGSLGYRLASGTLVYMPPTFEEKRIIVVDRDGVERALDLPPGPWATPRLSPDGKRLLFEGNSSVVEVLDLERGTRTVLAPPAFGSAFPIWTTDGGRVVSRRYNLPHWVAADGSGRGGMLPGVSINDYPSAAALDPDTLLMVRVHPQTGGDVMLQSIGGSFPPKALLATAAYEGGPVLSPDGRWLLHQSNASGRPEIYVRDFAALDRVWQVSEGGGVQSRWRADGGEIYYRSGQRMMASAFDGKGAEPRLGRPVALFRDEYDFGKGLSLQNYDVGRDGRFLMLRRTPSGGRLHVVLGWGAELERLIAAGGVR